MNNKERDMFYSNYGYAGSYPPNNMMYPNQPMMNQMTPMNMHNGSFPFEERLNKLERQLKHLEQRINRLETPYQDKNIQDINDNTMYMM